MKSIMLCCAVLLLAGCSGGESESEVTAYHSDVHADMINQAKDVENVLKDASADHNRQMEEQMQ